MRKEERHQIKRNDLATILETATDFVGEHFRGVLAGVVAIGVLALAIGGARAWWNAREARQARALGELIHAYNAPITASFEDLQNARGNAPAFTSTEERNRKVIEIAESILSDGGGQAAETGALLYRGMAEAGLGEADKAAASLADVLRRDPGSLFGAMARLRLARLHEGQGRPADALPLFQQISEDRDGFVPVEEGIMGMARCQEALGKPDEAARLYQRVIAEFPDSEYVAEARTRAAGRS